MEEENEVKQNCSSEEHINEIAISYCQECKIYMCEKCKKFHDSLFKKHHQFIIDKEHDIKEVFTGLCKEYNHNEELQFFCKTHNILCCAKCVSNIQDKNKEIGQHKNCKISFIQDFENEKKSALKENIKILDNLLNVLETSIVDLKKIFERVTKNKEELKISIQKTFTEIRNALNNREDELLNEIDNKYNLLLNIDKVNQIENLPSKNRTLLEKVKSIDYNWKNNKLNSLINDCINVENNIKEINIINDSVNSLKKINISKLEFKFSPEQYEVNNFLENIKLLGNIKNDLVKQFNSKIEFEENLIRTWLNQKEYIVELLFRKSKDGSKYEDFYNRCKNKGNIIIFIDTNYYKFGGYTEMGLEKKEDDSNDSNLEDNKTTFIFSFDENKKSSDKISFLFNSECMKFESSTSTEINIANSSLDKMQIFNKDQHCNPFLLNSRIYNYEKREWNIQELEVYKLIYI